MNEMLSNYKLLPMDKSLHQIPPTVAETIEEHSEERCAPKRSTLAFLRQFARTYTVVPNISGPAAELIPN